VAHLFEKHRALIEKYPPKRRILGVKRSRFEEAVKTGSQKAEQIDVPVSIDN